MSETATTSNQGVSAAAAQVVQAGDNVRDRVRDLTLRLLTERRLEAKAMQEALKAVTEGIAIGASRTGDMKAALADAFAGADEALSKLAHASRLALLELQSSSTRFAEEDLRAAIQRLVSLERDLLDAFGDASRAAGEEARKELLALLEHSKRTGTETGEVVARTMSELSQCTGEWVREVAAAGVHAGTELSGRMIDATLGILDGIAGSLRKAPNDALASERANE